MMLGRSERFPVHLGRTASREDRPPPRRASLDTSPPIDGGEEGCELAKFDAFPLPPEGERWPGAAGTEWGEAVCQTRRRSKTRAMTGEEENRVIKRKQCFEGRSTPTPSSCARHLSPDRGGRGRAPRLADPRFSSPSAGVKVGAAAKLAKQSPIWRQTSRDLAPNCAAPPNIDKKFRRHIFILVRGRLYRPAWPARCPEACPVNSHWRRGYANIGAGRHGGRRSWPMLGCCASMFRSPRCGRAARLISPT
ncbi:hypothetical protein FJ942_11300 [Mesorhizobium sp. B2-4-2]|nr:hypothetical protein FJ942_11300 [Mesorhizobium sp. B2-4-2]TPM10587.1 hypothetical protein FJ939_01605 [Mesorhizobium sp. B2-3-8]TPM20397.1 hypothetical protein FJ940_02300 [Mesorhizobium sp. B2-3-7]